jgi:hypothetical protein
MTIPFSSQVDERQLTGSRNQLRDARPTKLTQLLDMQDIVYRDVCDPLTTPTERSQAVRAWDVLEERIRILRGKTKAGSRNISVRESADGAGVSRRLAPARNRQIDPDYLARAAADLARAEALSATKP